MNALPIPNITLNTGTEIPQLGLGVFLVEPGETERLVSEALEAGYRHIDTAMIYRNEAEVGRAIAASGIPREELFITTKLWNTDQDRPAEAFQRSLDLLGLDRVDLYLIHWPLPMFAGSALGAWRGLLDIAESGRSSAVGVSNFEIEHLRQLIDETGVVPAVDQVELHPLHQRRELSAFCAEQGIAVEAWGPLAQGKTNLLELPAVVAAAEAHGKSPAQAVLRWHVQQGRIVFPKTSRRERLLENASIFDFELSGDEMAAIDALEAGTNFGPDPRSYDVR
ncbi:aldo/keto reductase [Leucobacter massiliensis]|uniref:2,5-diketo-D-gluconic acid reductase n=1 Tax=Leucobacter massiliensis TaxID=1686285 RepID=A0A2S9QML2_9MICO|nr:aldo/keto reductase [Leucobacter massiliensis]PRI10831.1 2,5-diketo-D-gluconic acid reductase [Leucobacter massiliensis]